MTDSAPTVVIGIGNPMRRDDGVGHALLDELDPSDLAAGAAVDLVALDGEATRLIEAWRGRRRAIVVDAGGRGDQPGSIHRLQVGVDELPDWTRTASSHATGLAEAVALGGAVEVLPEELIVLAVEPDDMSPGEGLSGPVASALPDLVEQVRREVRA